MTTDADAGLLHRVVLPAPYYEKDGITIYHGDSLDILPFFCDGSFAATVTDPPYVLGAASTRRGTRPQSPVADWTNASRLYRDWVGEMSRVTSGDGCVWMFGNWRTLPVLEIAVQSLAKKINSVLVWDKEWIGVGSMNGLRNQYELVFLIGGESFAIKDRSLPDVWREKWASSRPSGHPQEKPESLIGRILDHTRDGAVIDPFMGSGTTLAAAARSGRRAVGIEMEERYCEMAAKRLSQGVLL